MSETDGPTPGTEFNPQSGFPVADGSQSEQPPVAPPPPPYGQPQYGQPQYGPPQYGQPQYGQPFTSYAVPNHQKATTALVLGLVSLVGGFMCAVPLLVSPFAWVTGYKARKEIKAANGQLGGDGMATAGMVLGIIGCVLLALLLILVLILVVVAINDPSTFDDTNSTVQGLIRG